MTAVRPDGAARVRPGGARGPGSGDRGSSTVLVLAASACLAAVAFVLLSWTAGLARAARARAAADLAALAGAAAALRGGEPCAAAAVIAERNGAVLGRCQVDGWEVQVSVRVPSGDGHGAARAEARAGPASARAGPVSARAGPVSARAGPVSARAGPASARAGPVSARAGPASARAP